MSDKLRAIAQRIYQLLITFARRAYPILKDICQLFKELTIELLKLCRREIAKHPRLDGYYVEFVEFCSSVLRRYPFISRHYKTITISLLSVIIMLTQCISSSDLFGVRPINRLLSNEMSEFESIASLDKEIENLMLRWDLSGASFALMRNDSLIYAKGYGYADVEKKIKCDVPHLFRVASVSKLITATAIMKLVERKKLSLESKVFGEDGILNDPMFLDIKDANLKKITIENLLRHTGGFSSPIGDPTFNNSGVARALDKPLPLTTDDMVLYATKNKLKSRPGTSYEYSNLGYVILGRVIEEVTNMDYERFVKESVLAPAKCYDMHIGENLKRNRKRGEVNYYEVHDAEPVLACDGSGRMRMKSDGGNNVTLLGAAGGWIASPVELLRFVAAIDGCSVKEDILRAETIRTMTYDSATQKPIGWAKVNGDEWQRSGSMSGTSALLKREKNGYTWVLVTNRSTWIGYKLNTYISSQISRAVSRIKEWPERDMFTI